MQYKNGWKYGGGGGHDTRTMCKNGVCFDFPGLSQIWHHGLFNIEWWAAWFYFKTNIEDRAQATAHE